MKNTTNYNFRKPEPTDFYNIEDQNVNWDEADRVINEHKAADNPHKITKTTIGLENVENKSSETIRGEMTAENVNNALGYIAADKKELDDGLNHNVSNVVSDEAMVDLPESKAGGLRIDEIRGRTVQKKLSGTQLIQYEEWKKSSITRGRGVWENNGVTLVATDGDCYTSVNDETFPKIKVSPKEQITLSWENDTSVSGDIYIFDDKARIMKKANNKDTKKITVTIPEDVTYIKFRFGVSVGGQTIEYKNIMINKGSEPLPYEPYCGGIPTPNPEYEAKIENPSFSEVKSENINLLDMTNAKGGTDNGITVNMNDDGSYSYKGKATSAAINIWLKGSYSSKEPLLILSKGRYYIKGINLYYDSKPIITNGREGGIFFLQEGTKIGAIRTIAAENGKTYDETVYPIIIKSDVPVPFVPHQESKATLPLTTLADGDKIVEKDGVWGTYKTTAKETYDGNEGWNQYKPNIYVISTKNEIKNKNQKGKCNRFLNIYPNYAFADRINGAYSGHPTIKKYLYFAIDSVTSLTEWKAWLSTHPLTVEYELETPTFVPFEPSVQKQFNSLKTFDGITHVSTDSVIPPTMDLSYGNLNTSAEIIDLDNRMTNEESTLKELGTEVEEVKKNSKNNEMFIAPEVKDSGYYMIDLKKVIPGSLTFKIRIIDTGETKEIQVSGNGERTNGWSSYYAEMLYATYAGITPLLFGYRGTGVSPSHLCLAIEAKNVKNIEVFDASVEGEADQEFYKNLFSIYYAPNFTATLQETENLRSPRGKDMVNKEIHMNQGTVYELGGIKIYKKAIVVTHIAETSEVYIHTIVGQYGYLDGLEGGFKCNVNIARMGNSEKFDIVVKDSGYGPRITLINSTNGNTESTVFYM